MAIDSIIEEWVELKFPKEKQDHLRDVKQIIDDTIVDFHNFEFPKYIGNYKKYLGFVADRLSSIEHWQTNVDYPLVATVVDTMFGNIFDFGYEFGINEPKLKKLCIESFDFRGTGKKVFKEVTKEILIHKIWFLWSCFTKHISHACKGFFELCILFFDSSDVFLWSFTSTFDVSNCIIWFLERVLIIWELI